MGPAAASRRELQLVAQATLAIVHATVRLHKATLRTSCILGLGCALLLLLSVPPAQNTIGTYMYLTASTAALPGQQPLPTAMPESTEPHPLGAGAVRIVHQSWKTQQLPTRFHRWSSSFSSCLPNWQRKLWTDEDNERLVAEHFSWFLPTYRKLSQPVQKADVSRLFYMYKYGGVYCDLDCECLNPFEHLLGNVSLAFGAMEGHVIGPQDARYVEEGQIENSFMYSIPGHPFVMQLIKKVERSPLGFPEETTGPYMLMQAIRRMRKSEAGVPKEFRGKKYLEIFPPSYFNPFSWIINRVPDCKDRGLFNRLNEEKCREAHRNSSFILQYHTQVWRAGKRHLNDS